MYIIHTDCCGLKLIHAIWLKTNHDFNRLFNFVKIQLRAHQIEFKNDQDNCLFGVVITSNEPNYDKAIEALDGMPGITMIHSKRHIIQDHRYTMTLIIIDPKEMQEYGIL